MSVQQLSDEALEEMYYAAYVERQRRAEVKIENGFYPIPNLVLDPGGEPLLIQSVQTYHTRHPEIKLYVVNMLVNREIQKQRMFQSHYTKSTDNGSRRAW